ncbi:MAG: Flp pilus assembly protein CpaB [Bdellovibrionales bacterium]
MPKRKIVLLLAAFTIAAITVMAARSMMVPPSADQGIQTPAEAASQVLAAARDLPIGTLLKDTDLKWIPWPTEAQNSNLFVKGTADKTAVIGSVLRQGIRADTPVLGGQIVNPHAQGFLAAVLQPGMRAMSITINPSSQVAGFIFPGDRVDVILTLSVSRRDEPDLTDRHMSETVLTNVRVLALDQKSDDQGNLDPKLAQLATLEVTPQQAERLALGAQLGSLSLSLRSLASEEPLPDPLSPDQLTDASRAALDSHTWDSDLSQAFPALGGEDRLLQKVQIMRGKDTSETIFQRRR